MSNRHVYRVLNSTLYDNWKYERELFRPRKSLLGRLKGCADIVGLICDYMPSSKFPVPFDPSDHKDLDLKGLLREWRHPMETWYCMTVKEQDHSLRALKIRVVIRNRMAAILGLENGRDIEILSLINRFTMVALGSDGKDGRFVYKWMFLLSGLLLQKPYEYTTGNGDRVTNKYREQYSMAFSSDKPIGDDRLRLNLLYWLANGNDTKVLWTFIRVVKTRIVTEEKKQFMPSKNGLRPLMEYKKVLNKVRSMEQFLIFIGYGSIAKAPAFTHISDSQYQKMILPMLQRRW